MRRFSRQRTKESACSFWGGRLDASGWGYGKAHQAVVEEVLLDEFELHEDVVHLIHTMLLRKGAKIPKKVSKRKKWRKRLGLTRKKKAAKKVKAPKPGDIIIRELKLRQTVGHFYKEKYSDSELSGRFQSDFVEWLSAEDFPADVCGWDAAAGKPQRLAVSLFGANFVGKSTIVSRLISDTFLNEYETTIEEMSFSKDITVDEMGVSILTLDILDTNGADDATRQWNPRGDAFVIVERMQSTELYSAIETENWIKRVRKEKEKNGAAIVLLAVGLDSALCSAHKCTQTRQMIALAKKYNVPYLELSCKSAVDAKSPLQQVTELFQFVAKYEKLYELFVWEKRAVMEQLQLSGALVDWE